METLTIKKRADWPKVPLNREYLNLLFWLLVFLLSPRLLREIDMTSAPVDPGALSAIIMAVLSVLLFQALTWWIIRKIWPVFSEYSEFHFERNFKSLLSWQKVLIYLGFYLSLLFSFVFTLAAMF